MSRPIVALVLAGGTGTRLYPASRSDRPKQFRTLGGDESLLSRTVDRLSFADETYVLTAERFADRVREHAPRAGVLVEPAPMDTGPALVYGAARIREQVGDCALACVPSDHHVDDDDAFRATIEHAAAVALETKGLVTVGVDPDRPVTGYGYVDPGRWQDGYAPVEEFREKPDRETAASLVDRGCLWNAGVFVWTPDAFLAEARATPLSPVVDAVERGAPERGFEAVDPVSVDEAVMERTENAFVVAAEFGWDDLGTWDAVGRVLADRGGDGTDDNAVLGDALALDARDNVIVADGAHVTAVDVDELVIAAVDDRVLVVPTDEAQRVRDAVDALRDRDLF